MCGWATVLPVMANAREMGQRPLASSGQPLGEIPYLELFGSFPFLLASRWGERLLDTMLLFRFQPIGRALTCSTESWGGEQ